MLSQHFYGYDPILSSLPEPIRQSVIDMVTVCQVSVPMAIMLHLAIVSSVCQGAYDVIGHDERPTPCLLWLIILAKSGDRKSSAMRHGLNFVYQLIDRISVQYEHRYGEYRVRKTSFDTVTKGLKRKLEQEVREGKSYGETAQSLADHLVTEPSAPQKNQLLYDDITIPALLEQMADHTPLATLNWDEGAPRIKALSNQHISILNKLFDGDDAICQRKGEPDKVIKSPRLTMCIAAQPEVWKKTLGERLDYFEEVGLQARCFILETPSLQGLRQKNDSPFTYREFGREQFESRLLQIAEATYGTEDGTIPPRKTLGLSPEAKLLALREYNNIENLIGRFGSYEPIAAHASKLPNLILRVACLYTAVCSDSDEISAEMYDRAAYLGHFFAGEQLRMKQKPLQFEAFVDPVEDGCNRLQQFFLRMYREKGWCTVTKRCILRNGPGGLRTSSALMPVLHRMQFRGQVKLQNMGKGLMVSWPTPFFGTATSPGASSYAPGLLNADFTL
ncbi:DUF3987 domain-containing protein [Chitinimonas sp. JJ19]|uniref:DUF3987 domain-containing protein n=1 Tax=Chitinimonas sp. JJ19 TaxID=3109352 RepID=UPI0030024DCD